MQWNFLYLGFPYFDYTSIENKPLGGVESSLIYLMRSLVKKGDEVFFFAPNVSEFKINNFSQINLKNFHIEIKKNSGVLVYSGDLLQIKKIKEIIKDIPFFLWMHHAANQESVNALANQEVTKNLTSIIFVSEWQKNGFLKKFNINNIPNNIIGHGISYEYENLFLSFDDFKKQKENNYGIYTSTPFRGLEILIEIEKFLNNRDIKIDIFSGMGIYSMSDLAYADLFKRMKDSKIFNNYGPQIKINLANFHKNKSFLFYPSIFAETFCISVLDALASGCDVVTTNFGCLKEIYEDYATFMEFDSERTIYDIAKKFALIMDQSIERKNDNFDKWAERKFKQMIDLQQKFSWSSRAIEWQTTAKKFL